VVVNIVSTNAVQPAQSLSAYCAAQGGGGDVQPGRGDGAGTARHPRRRVGPGADRYAATAPFLQQDKARAAFLGNIPAGRAARAEEIAG